MEEDEIILENNDEMSRCLKDLRKKAKLTAEEFGKLAGLSQNYITRIENGNIKKPSFETMLRIAQAASKLNVVKYHDIDLEQYNTLFAKTIQLYSDREEVLHSQEINNELSIKIEGSRNYITDDDKQFITRYLEFSEYLDVLNSFISESKRKAQSGDFVKWFASEVNKLSQHQQIVNELNESFQKLNNDGVNPRIGPESSYNGFLCHYLKCLITTSQFGNVDTN